MKITLTLIAAVVFAFAVGALGGYAARSMAASPTAAASRQACPPGAHPVVWYTAKSWSCLSD